MTGILPLARQLNNYFEHSKPVEELQQIGGPMRPSRGRWPKEVWAEMQAIYSAPDPCEPWEEKEEGRG